VLTRYIYDPYGNLLAEADESDQITRRYLYGNGLLAMATSDARYCYHFNATGSTIALTDMSQVVVNSYTYEPFGQILAQEETVAQPFKFVGQYGVMAEPNDLYYMRARYYDPAVGRFISEDPLGFGGGDVNLLSYVQNDPVANIDPLGLKRVWIAIPVPIPLLIPTPAGPVPIIVPLPIPFPITIPDTKPIENRGHTDPAWTGNYLPVNPGRDECGNCRSCPPDSPVWTHTHQDGTVNSHQIVYDQNKQTCECFPKRIHK
jgi:RHS repeat-associated protein